MKKLSLLSTLAFVMFVNRNAPAQSDIAFQWATSAGGTSYDEAYSVAVDANGNTYMAGYFNSASITFGTTTLTSAGSYDIVIVKYSPSGNVLWAKSVGGTFGDVANSVATDVSGNVYVVGYFQGSITFGSTTLTNVGSNDMFLVKYDSNGNVLWAKSSGGSSDDYARSAVSDASGNTYVAGSFQSPFNGNANDESGNGNNGTVNGATLTTDRFGNANKAYSFDSYKL